ncbi:MAG: hypothetical protein LBS63_01305 [Prevotellaceae bacterium]|jgi:hypothetical protein|nr:hypothetical protein [Prevotellaceae bacterium]
MKTIKNILLMLAAAAALNGCENYSETEIEYSPIFPLSGEWRIRVTDADVDTLVTKTMYTFATYNTADNVATQMWIRTTSSMAGGVGALGAVRGKVSCDVAGLSFSGADVENLAGTAALANTSFSISEGKVTRDALTMPSQAKADKISFKLTSMHKPGKTYLLEGYRRTMWPEDETVLNF